MLSSMIAVLTFVLVTSVASAQDEHIVGHVNDYYDSGHRIQMFQDSNGVSYTLPVLNRHDWIVKIHCPDPLLPVLWEDEEGSFYCSGYPDTPRVVQYPDGSVYLEETLY